MRRGSDLTGVSVVLTRQPEDNAVLATSLREAGAHVLELPCVRTTDLDDPSELASALLSLRPIDVLVLTSRRAVRAVSRALRGASAHCPVAVVGDATAREARALGMAVSFVPSRADGHTLGSELPLPVGDVLLARSDLADADLPAILRERGARVRELVGYRTEARLDGDAMPLIRAIDAGPVAIVVASPSAVTALAAIGPEPLRRATFVAIGPRTATSVREIVGAPVVVAADPSPASILSALRAESSRRRADRGARTEVERATRLGAPAPTHSRAGLP